MTVSFDLTSDLKGLDALANLAGDGSFVKVGVLGDNTSRDDSANGSTPNNPTLGLIQIFGSLSKNIPPRDFLRMPLQHKRGELLRFAAGKKVSTLIQEGNKEDALALLGVKAETIVDEAFATNGFGQWAANAPSTIAQKGSSSPLIDTSQLRRSVTSEVSSA